MTFHTPRTWQLFGSFYATLRPQSSHKRPLRSVDVQTYMAIASCDFPCDSFYDCRQPLEVTWLLKSETNIWSTWLLAHSFPFNIDLVQAEVPTPHTQNTPFVIIGSTICSHIRDSRRTMNICWCFFFNSDMWNFSHGIFISSNIVKLVKTSISMSLRL